jgi:Tfp pilus assembly PilM family ATPase
LRDRAPDEKLRASIEGPLLELVREIGETLRHLTVRQRMRRVSHVYVFGGLALLAGLSERLNAALGVAVEHPDPLAGMVVPADGRPEPEDRVRLVTAAGLARWWESGEV